MYSIILLCFTLIEVNAQLYYHTLEQFKDDSIQAILYKKNKVKSVSKSNTSFYYKNYGDHKTLYEKIEIDTNGNEVKVWIPDTNLIMYRGGRGRLSENDRIDSTTYHYNSQNKRIKEIIHIRSGDETKEYFYGKDGHLISILDETYNDHFWKWIFEYDHLNHRIIEICLYDGQRGDSTFINIKITSYYPSHIIVTF